MQTVSISARFDPETLSRLDELANGLGISRSSLLKKAVANYLDYDFWFQERVKEGLEDIGAGRVSGHDEVIQAIGALGYDVD